MIKRPAIFSISGVVLLLFGMLGMWLSARFGDTRMERMILMVVMWVLGLIAAGLIYIWLAAKAKAAPVAAAASDEIGNIMNAAKARLVSAKGKAAAQFGRMPLILVTGPSGAAKTTVITRSGVEAELLSGEVYRGETVLPTSEINVWFAHNNLIVEAGGGITEDEARWRRLLRLVQPSRAAAVLSRGKQAPRVAIVCMPCDEFMKPAAGQSVAALAQKLRQRLADAAHELGIRLPVYVIFTKLDRVKYFEDYFRSHTRAETAEVLGATLPIQPLGNPGAFAEREARRLGEAFHTLFRGLALRRTELLPRERDDVVKAGTYEFPREFRKITDLATQFLIDLCRPSQLGAGPFLRGFYFTGVRAVFKQDTAAAPPPLQSHAGPSILDATSVFDPRMLQAQAPAYQAAAGTRKVPEWVFLDRIFRDLVLKDAVAQGVTAGGSKVTLWRRALLAAAIATILFVTGAMTISYFGNRRLLANTATASENARNLALTAAVPELDAMQRLDALRQRTAELDRYAYDGRPTRLGWGLYEGHKVQSDVRAYYFERFEELLWAPTRTAMQGSLSGLVPGQTANANYDDAYNSLKAYLITTAHPEKSDTTFLVPILEKFWSLNLGVDSAVRELARKQFAFFASELPYGHPLPQPANTPLVAHARNYLTSLASNDNLYSVLLQSARDSVQAPQWADPIVTNATTIKPEFTKAGWTRADHALKNIDALLDRESWVLGEDNKLDPVARSRLAQTLRQRYEADYVSAWVDFLRGGKVALPSNVNDAGRALNTLATSASPILRMVRLAAEQTTGLDSAKVGVTFRPAHVVAAASSPIAAEYIPPLIAFRSNVEQFAGSRGPEREAAKALANSSAQQVRAAVAKLETTVEPQSRASDVALAIRDLMEAPLRLTRLFDQVSVNEMNAVGVSFCSVFDGLARKFPFSRTGPEATIDEIVDVFAPNSGKLWTFYEQNLQELIDRRGRPLSRPGAEFQVDPRFSRYFQNLVLISDGFFNEGSTDPIIEATLTMNASSDVPRIEVNVGRRLIYEERRAPGQTLVWRGASTEAKIEARVGNANVPYVSIAPSIWSVFRMFYLADFQRRNERGAYNVTWSVGNHPPISGILNFEEDAAVFDPSVLTRLSGCVRTVVTR